LGKSLLTVYSSGYLADVADLDGGCLDLLGGSPDPGVVDALAHVGLDLSGVCRKRKTVVTPSMDQRVSSQYDEYRWR